MRQGHATGQVRRRQRVLKDQSRIDLSFPYHGHSCPEGRLGSLVERIRKFRSGESALHDSEVVGALEARVSGIFGFDAAMWCPTGTLAQTIAARIYTECSESKRLGLHPTSHLLLHEEDGYKKAHGLSVRCLGNWNRSLSAPDLKADVACTFVELPQRHNGGELPHWDEWLEIKRWSSSSCIPLHVDGARIWGCRQYYAQRSYADILDGVSSVYVSLYKDIGAIGGAVLLGGRQFIEAANVWKTRLGGLMIDPAVLAWDALTLIDEKISRMTAYVDKARRLSNCVAIRTDWQTKPASPHVNMFHVQLPFSRQEAIRRRDEAARASGVWLANDFWDQPNSDHCTLELVVGDTALGMKEGIFAEAIGRFHDA